MKISLYSNLLNIIKLGLFLGLFLFAYDGQAQIKPMIKKRTTKAVIIGVADYQNPNIADLQFTDDDAIAFADYLRSPAGGSVPENNITLLTNEQATYGKVVMALTTLMEECKEGDLAVIYFSGHGDVETTTMMNFGYLLTYEAPSAVYMIGGALSISNLEAIIQTLTVQKNVEVLLIADACHAGKLAGSAVKGTEATAHALTANFAKAAKILSCQPNELSQESTRWGGGHSVFTYFLIDGLIGLADENHDNKVSMFEIQKFLQEKVPPEVAPQSQIPGISGNISLQVAKVDPPSLAALIKRRQPGEPEKSATLQNPGTDDLASKSGDSLTMALFRQFNQALALKQLLYPKDNSAYALFKRIKDKPELANEQNQMRNDLAAGLQDEAQQAINAYLAASPEELHRRWSYDTSFQRYPEYLAKAAEIVGPQHFLYTELKAKQLYFEGLDMRLKAEKDKNPMLFDNAQLRQEMVISLAPNAAYAFNELGLLSRRKKEYEKSLDYFNKAIEVAPTWVLAQTNTCSSYLDIDQVENAIEHCNLAVQSDSSFALAWHHLGIAYSEKGEYSKAIYNYLKALSHDPHYPTTYYKLGNAYYFSGDKQKAAESWRACIKEAPKGQFAPESWNNLATLAEEEKDFEAALGLLIHAIEVRPDYKDALFEKSVVHGTLGQDEAAIEALKLALDKGYKRKESIFSAPALERVRNMPVFLSLMQQYFPE